MDHALIERDLTARLKSGGVLVSMLSRSGKSESQPSLPRGASFQEQGGGLLRPGSSGGNSGSSTSSHINEMTRSSESRVSGALTLVASEKGGRDPCKNQRQ